MAKEPTENKGLKEESSKVDAVDFDVGPEVSSSKKPESAKVSAPPKAEKPKAVKEEEGELPTGKGGQFRAIGGGKVVPV